MSSYATSATLPARPGTRLTTATWACGLKTQPAAALVPRSKRNSRHPHVLCSVRHPAGATVLLLLLLSLLLSSPFLRADARQAGGRALPSSPRFGSPQVYLPEGLLRQRQNPAVQPPIWLSAGLPSRGHSSPAEALLFADAGTAVLLGPSWGHSEGHPGAWPHEHFRFTFAVLLVPYLNHSLKHHASFVALAGKLQRKQQQKGLAALGPGLARPPPPKKQAAENKQERFVSNEGKYDESLRPGLAQKQEIKKETQKKKTTAKRSKQQKTSKNNMFQHKSKKTNISGLAWPPRTSKQQQTTKNTRCQDNNQ